MTAELPEGFHDPVAIARADRVHSEAQRLAHSSPPVAGREARIRELKAAVSILVEYQFGFTSVRWFLSNLGRMAVSLAVLMLAAFVLTIVRSDPGRLPTASEWIRAVAYALVCLVGVVLWDFLKTRRRLRMAEALADSLVEPPAKALSGKRFQ